MAKHIGIVACSAEGAALCYRTICVEASRVMGEYMHPQITMHTHCLGEYMGPIETGDQKKVAELMLSSANKVADAGAEFAICPDNTIHEAFEFVIRQSPLPWLHIAEEVGKEAQAQGFRKLGVLGTKFLMLGPVYSQTLIKMGIATDIPNKDDQEKINRIIFSELVNGVFAEASRLYFNEVIQKLKTQGAQAVILGCTEIPLLIRPDDCPLPALDSTRILARAAIKEALR